MEEVTVLSDTRVDMIKGIVSYESGKVVIITRKGKDDVNIETYSHLKDYWSTRLNNKESI